MFAGACSSAPPGWAGMLAGIVLSRIFDMTKPFPCRRLEKLPSGYGIVLDDIGAGVWAAAFLGGLRFAGWL